MTVKEYLSRYGDLCDRLAEKRERLYTFYSMATRKTTNIEKVKITTGENRIELFYEKILDLEREIEAGEYELIDLAEETEDIINGIKNDKYKEILERRYLKRQSVSEIAEDMKFSHRWICKLHGEALKEMEKIYN